MRLKKRNGSRRTAMTNQLSIRRFTLKDKKAVNHSAKDTVDLWRSNNFYTIIMRKMMVRKTIMKKPNRPSFIREIVNSIEKM